MAFPGLYNEVTHVPSKPATTVPTAAVLTHVLHLLMCLLYPRIYCPYYYLLHAHVLYLRTAVQYVLHTATRTYCAADVRTYE